MNWRRKVNFAVARALNSHKSKIIVLHLSPMYFVVTQTGISEIKEYDVLLVGHRAVSRSNFTPILSVMGAQKQKVKIRN